MMNGTASKMLSENGTKGAFDPETYYPEPKFSSSAVAERLKKSILSEVSEEEAASRIELAAAYRVFAKKVISCCDRQCCQNSRTMTLLAAWHAQTLVTKRLLDRLCAGLERQHLQSPHRYPFSIRLGTALTALDS